MVERDTDDRPDLLALAPPTLKGLRRLRGVRPPTMAAKMDMSLRAFENFENGKGRLNTERIHQFATLLGADPHAVLAAFEIRSPEFALRCANNKLMSILMLALEDFDAKAQDLIVGLDPLALMKAFRAFFDQLIELAKEEDGVVAEWRRARAAGEAETPPGPFDAAAPDDEPEGDTED